MSRATLDNIRDIATRAAIDVAWAQWGCLTHSAASVDTRPVSSIVDAEALVLVSMWLQGDERRMRDLLAALARNHAKLLSVHRMQQIGSRFPDEVQPMIHEFAYGRNTRAGRNWGSSLRWRVPLTYRAGKISGRSDCSIHPCCSCDCAVRSASD